MTDESNPSTAAPSADDEKDDVASLLSRLPANGREDYVTRVMDIYEAAERQYRAAQRTGAQRIGSSASTSA